MKCSVCLSTYSKPKYLRRVLESIVVQQPGFEFEVIVVDDGSANDETCIVCEDFPNVVYQRIERAPGYRNPAAARNVAYRRARGGILVLQSDDVEHKGESIRGLVDELRSGEFVIATVLNCNWDGSTAPWPLPILTGPSVQRPLFFLGAVARRDVYAIGGNEELFVAPGREDVFFADCLMNGLKIMPRYLSSVVGWHLHHSRPANLRRLVDPSERLYKKLIAKCSASRRWVSSSGPWTHEEGPSIYDATVVDQPSSR